MKLAQFLRQRRVSKDVQEALEDVLVELADLLKLDEDAFLTGEYQQDGSKTIIYDYDFDTKSPILANTMKYFKSLEKEDMYEPITFSADKKPNISTLMILDDDEYDNKIVYLKFAQRYRLDPVQFEITIA